MPLGVNVSVIDSQGKTSSFTFNLDDAVSDPAATAQAIIEDIDPLIDGVITGVSYTTPIDKTGWTIKSAQTADNNRSDGGRFIFADGAGNKTTLTLPTFDRATYVPAASENIDQANVDVSTFLATFLGQLTTTTHGEEVTQVVAAYEVFGGKRN